MSYDRYSCTKSQIALRGFRKSDANLTSDLLVFDFWVHFFQKIHQKPQKVIVFLVQNLDQIGQGFFDIWIARWIKFFRKVFALFDLGLLHGVNWAQNGTKNADFENVLPAVGKIWKFQKELYIPQIPIRTTCGPNFSLIGRFLRELLPPNPQNWDQLGHEPKKLRCIFQVKSRTTNTQKLNLVDPRNIEKFGCYRLCENLC